MIQELADRVWEAPELHQHRRHLALLWLQKELNVADQEQEALDDADLNRLLQAAAILAASSDDHHRKAAYDIATYAHDLSGDQYAGLAGLVRVVLARLGNFPAFSTSSAVAGFERLPVELAIEEERRRQRNRIVAGDAHLTLTDFQSGLWSALVERANVSISGPTSAGKSFVLQTYPRQRAARGELRHACYLVPSRALITQVTDDILAWRNADQLMDIVVANVPISAETALPQRGIFVLTQERLQVLLGGHPSFSPEIIIVDEAQNVQDGSRGVLLSSVVEAVLANNTNAQTIFAGPNLKNVGIFSRMFDLQDMRENKTRSVVVGQNLINVDTRSFEKGRLTFETLGGGSRDLVGSINVGALAQTKRERLARVAKAVGQRSATIVYADDPQEAEEIAKKIASGRDEVDDESLVSLSTFIADAVHKKYVLADYVRKRVGFHYGRMPSLVRRAIEEAFSRGELDVLVTTSTLLQGVNFPAKNLLMCDPRKGKDNPLDGSDFWNLAGRAGRLGREFHGNVYLIDYDTWRRKPLDSDREIEITPYLTEAVTLRRDELLAAARNPDPEPEKETTDRIESALLRLHLDAKAGRLGETLRRCGVDETSPAGLEIARVIEAAEAHVVLPRKALLASPTVAAFRQQRLFNFISATLDHQGEMGLGTLMPRHPRDMDARGALSRIYDICQQKILGIANDRLAYRFAAISVSWMRGESMQEIIDTNARFAPTKGLQTVIRGTLKDIEQDVRFRYFRLTSCYLVLLEHALRQRGWDRFLSSIPALPLFLEVGASSATMISLMSLGLSRVTASRLALEIDDEDLDPVGAAKWLASMDLDKVNVSRVLAADVRRTISQVGPV